MKTLWLLLLILAPSVAQADKVLVIREDGRPYIFDTETAQVIQEVEVDRIYIPKAYAPNPPGNPQPPDNPNPPDNPAPDELTKKVQKWAEEIDDPIGAAIFGQGVWATLQKEMQKGQIPVDAGSVNKGVVDAIKQALNLYPGDKKQQWEDLNDKVLGELSKLLIQSGGKLTQAQYTAFFGKVADGLEAAKAGAAIPIWLEPIIAELIKIIIRMLQDLFAYSPEQLDSIHEILTDIMISTPVVFPRRNKPLMAPRPRGMKGA